MLTVDHLLVLADRYRDHRIVRGRRMSLARLSTLLFDDGKRLKFMVENNGDIGSRKLIEAVQWFSDNWLVDDEWPEGIPRPRKTPPVSTSTVVAESHAP